MSAADEAFVQVRRDPFARVDLVRRVVDGGPYADCQWCGAAHHGKTKQPGLLFEYGWWSDSGRKSWNGKLFCCLGWFESYTS